MARRAKTRTVPRNPIPPCPACGGRSRRSGMVTIERDRRSQPQSRRGTSPRPAQGGLFAADASRRALAGRSIRCDSQYLRVSAMSFVVGPSCIKSAGPGVRRSPAARRAAGILARSCTNPVGSPLTGSAGSRIGSRRSRARRPGTSRPRPGPKSPSAAVASRVIGGQFFGAPGRPPGSLWRLSRSRSDPGTRTRAPTCHHRSHGLP